MNIETLFQVFDTNPTGIIQAGSHHAEEYFVYLRYLRKNMLFFEPQPEAYAISKKLAKCADVVNLALGAYSGTVNLYIPSKHNASASVLPPKLHLRQYPEYVFDEVLPVQQVRLDDYIQEHKLAGRYDTLILDVQGYELEVLQGAVETLKDISYIFTEVNREELFFGCVLVGELEEFLFSFGYELLDVEWFGGSWGNAIYGRKSDKTA